MTDMSKQKRPSRKSDPDSKRTAGVDRHTKPREAFHADQELFDAMNRLIAESRPKTNKTEVLRTALEDYLASKGYWPPKPDPKPGE